MFGREKEKITYFLLIRDEVKFPSRFKINITKGVTLGSDIVSLFSIYFEKEEIREIPEEYFPCNRLFEGIFSFTIANALYRRIKASYLECTDGHKQHSRCISLATVHEGQK